SQARFIGDRLDQDAAQLTEVIKDIRFRPRGLIAQTLSLPLLLRLAVEELRRDAGKVLGKRVGAPDSVEGRQDLGQELIRYFIQNACEHVPWRREIHTAAFHRSAPYYEVGDVLRWHATLAGRLTGASTTERPLQSISPHEMWLLRRPVVTRAVASLLTLACWLPVLCLALYALRLRHSGMAQYLVATALALTVPAGSVLFTLSRVKPALVSLDRFRNADGWRRVGFGVLISAVLFAHVALLGSAKYASMFSMGFCFTFAVTFATVIREEVDEIACVFGASLIGLMAIWLVRAAIEDAPVLVALLGGFIAGGVALLFGELLGQIVWRRRPTVPPPEPSRWVTRDPYFRLRAEALAVVVILVVVAAVTAWVLFETHYLIGSPAQLGTIAILSGIAASAGLAAVGWRRYLAMKIINRGSLPRFLRAFLRWSEQVHILRKDVFVYKYSHDFLRDHFVHETSSSR
ncbi:MAG: hypothetical protein JO144_09815, partial [Actinobacteria bacterium]|nr:hypothetical protein [Actinomycetota bacterium]